MDAPEKLLSTEKRKLHINELPIELLAQIFEIGCEVYISLNQIDISYRYEAEQVFFTRVKKPFVALASKVCRAWQNLVEIGYNPHYWVIGLPLICSRGYKDPDTQLGRFKSALDMSKGCDLEIFWEVERYRNLSELENPAVVSTRLLMHGLRMLQKHVQQIKCLDVRVGGPNEVVLLFELLRKFGPLPRLEWLSMQSPFSASSVSEALIDPRIASDEVMNNFPLEPTRDPPSQIPFPSLRHLDMHAIYIWNDIKVPVSLESLHITLSTSMAARVDWRTVIRFISPLQRLRVLRLELLNMQGSPDQSPFSSTFHTLPSLKYLLIGGEVSWTLAFLKHFKLPNLDIANLIAMRDPIDTVYDITWPTSKQIISISAPQVALDCPGSSALTLLRVLRMPNLELLKITSRGPTFAPMAPVHSSRSGKGAIILVPMHLHLSGFGIADAIRLLSQTDLEATEDIIFSDSTSEDMNLNDEDGEDIVINAPQLTHVELKPHSIERLSHLALHIDAPNLVSIKLTLTLPGYQYQPHPRQQVGWKDLDTELLFFSNITILQTNLIGPLDPTYEHPLLPFPNVQYLTIDMSPFCDAFLEWLVLPAIGVRPLYKGREVILPHLRTLHVLLVSEVSEMEIHYIKIYLRSIDRSRRERGLGLEEVHIETHDGNILLP